jgi:hypothetical protein
VTAGAMYLLALGVSLLALTTACAPLEDDEDKPFLGQDEILYGPEQKPATVDCEESDALDDVGEYEFDRAWSCEIVLKDGSGRALTCWAIGKSPGSGGARWTRRARNGRSSCEELAAKRAGDADEPRRTTLAELVFRQRGLERASEVLMRRAG